MKALTDRYFDINLHKFWEDAETNQFTFPLWNLSGQMVGYQKYNPNTDNKKTNDPKEGRYYTFQYKNNIAVWGMESWKLSNTLFLSEGVFDAARLSYYKQSSLALLSSDISKSTKSWLKLVRKFRKVVVICDNDENLAGNKLAKYGHLHYKVESGNDLGDASDDEVAYIIEEYGK